MARPKGSKNKPKEVIKHDLGDDLPKIVELKQNELHKALDYKHVQKGRYWRDGCEIVCVLLLEKHK